MTDVKTVAEIYAQKDADLETVKRLCKTHGFTSTMLRGCLKTREKSAQ